MVFILVCSASSGETGISGSFDGFVFIFLIVFVTSVGLLVQKSQDDMSIFLRMNFDSFGGFSA